ncbi:MAG: amino acid permease [Methanomassiliicoccales archaeon]|nr:amino acid permease [Methanomassiliicoccales archaeon]NYT15452.1 amino acid permease [Methanomassiliicoccales archaeon]
MGDGGRARGKLRLADAVGMAIGGMVGGGIFAVLGEAVLLSGNAAFISFGLAGVIALITGISLSLLTINFGERSGSLNFVRAAAGRKAEGIVSWFLIVGYIFTISLYAYTFGAYGGRLIGLDPSLNGLLGAIVIGFFVIINFMGVRESGISEDILVYTKVGILILVSAVGFLVINEGEMLPVFEHGIGGAIAAASLIFVAYEGFELLAFDYEDIEDHRRNLPRAVMISVVAVTLIYMLVAFVTTATVSDSVIQEHSEIVLAYVAEPVLGRIGFVLVLVAAVFSTASAINATLFSSGRLAKQAASDNQLPKGLIARHMGGVPVYFVLFIAICAMIIQLAGSLDLIASFSSLVFLAVFSVVNLSAYKHRQLDGWKLALPLLGFLACLGAIIFLCFTMFQSDPSSILLIGALALAVIAFRAIFTRWHPSFRSEVDRNTH